MKPPVEVVNPTLDQLDSYREYLQLMHPLDVLGTRDPWFTRVGLILAAHCSDAAVKDHSWGFLVVSHLESRVEPQR